MIATNDHCKDTFFHGYSQEELKLLQEQCSEFFNKYFIEI